MEHCFLIRLPADGAEGRGAGPCPGRAAPSSELILADVFLCGVLPEEDGARAGSGVSPGTRVRPASAGRRAGLILLCAGQALPALRGADAASSCAYASASPVLHAGDSGNMMGSGFRREREFLFTHRSTFTICQS